MRIGTDYEPQYNPTEPLRVREMIRLVEKAGWVLDRFDGTSHRQYRHPNRSGLVTIAGAESKELKKGWKSV